MPKTWEQLSQPEKIEDLRRDVQRLFAAINSTNGDLSAVSSKLTEVGDAVLKLEEGAFPSKFGKGR